MFRAVQLSGPNHLISLGLTFNDVVSCQNKPYGFESAFHPHSTPMEQILNLKHLGGIDDLRPFFGEIQAIKQGKYYHLVGDAHLNHTEFARFTKRPRFSSMGTVIYAGLNRICKLTQKMPSDFAVRLLQPN